MKISKGIIYVNFAPYDNTGNILDFLRDNFSFVAHFSLQFHHLNNRRQGNVLTIYKQGKKTYYLPFFNPKMPEPLLFLFLPITSSLFLLQLIWYIFLLRIRGNKFDYFFSVNALTTWLGNILRSINVVKETIFWVWDYYPTADNPWEVKLMRSLYWHFDKEGVKKASYTFFLDPKLQELRRELNLIPKDKYYSVIPIGINIQPSKKIERNTPIIGYLGVIKKSQGLDLIFDTVPRLLKLYPNLKIEIIGSGPYEDIIIRKAKKFKSIVKLYGYVESLDNIISIMRRWSVGVATYIPTPDNPAFYTDSSKIKAYLGTGTPVICTDVTPFAKEIKKNKSGIIIKYGDKDNFILSIDKLIKKQPKYSKNALSLAKKYNYKKIYKLFFSQ